MVLFVVPTTGFKLLYGSVIMRLHRRDLVWINVTANPTAEWVARQITEAFPWDGDPLHMIRDRDRIYGAIVTRRLRTMGIEISQLQQPRPARMALPNGYRIDAARVLGSCGDLGRDAFASGPETHRSLNKDAPVSRPVQRIGVISSRCMLGGLHHQYARVLVGSRIREVGHVDLVVRHPIVEIDGKVILKDRQVLV
jgi:hypothetical protein